MRYWSWIRTISACQCRQNQPHRIFNAIQIWARLIFLPFLPFSFSLSLSLTLTPSLFQSSACMIHMYFQKKSRFTFMILSIKLTLKCNYKWCNWNQYRSQNVWPFVRCPFLTVVLLNVFIFSSLLFLFHRNINLFRLCNARRKKKQNIAFTWTHHLIIPWLQIIFFILISKTKRQIDSINSDHWWLSIVHFVNFHS